MAKKKRNKSAAPKADALDPTQQITQEDDMNPGDEDEVSGGEEEVAGETSPAHSEEAITSTEANPEDGHAAEEATPPVDENFGIDAPAQEEPAVEAPETAQEPPVAAEAAPAPEPAPAPVAPASAVVQPAMVDDAYSNALGLLNSRFEAYCEAMGYSKPVGETEGAKQQVILWRIIESVLNTDGQGFAVMFTQLMSLFNRERQGRGALSERLRYRYFGAIRLGSVEARNFEKILSALLTVCNPQDRALKIKMVDFAAVFKDYPNKNALQHVVDYFGL